MKRKALLSLLLCLTLVIGLPPAPALAVSEPWDGVAVDTSWYADPTASAFTISDGADLAGLAKLVNDGTATFAGKTITMADDIDLGGKLNPPSNWTPIGGETRHFLGNFDGAGHQVRNLYCSWTAPVNWPQVGLFGHLGNNSGNKATVRNLGVVDCAVSLTTGLGNTGGLVGYALYAVISKCYVTGSVTSVSYVGGLAGGHANGLISDCYSTATVKGFVAGGLVGMGGSVQNSFFYGSIDVTSSTKGGLVGFNPYSLTSCVYLVDDPHNPSIPAIGDIADGWSYTETNLFAASAQGFATEEVALVLNTTYMTTPNSGIWSQGAAMPVYAGGSYLPIYMVTLVYSNGVTRFTCSRADGTIFLPTAPTDTVAGKAFLGWYTDGTYGTAFNPNSTFNLTADNTLTIHGNFGVRKVTLGDYSAPFSSSPVEYGGTVSDNASGIAGAAPLTYTYYTDLQGLNRTTTVNGAVSDGAAPANPGTYYVRANGAATATVDAASSNLATMAITSNPGAPSLSITTTTLPTATVGGVYSQAIVCSYSGGNQLSYSASGLPSGLSIDADTGVISGTPVAGTDIGSPYSVAVGVSDGATSASKTCTLAVQPATAGAFVVSGGAPGTHYTYAGNTLTFTQSGTYRVSMRTGVLSTTTDRIVVANGATANLTLNGVVIDLSETDSACALNMAGATVNLTLENQSILSSGRDSAGVFCPVGATLTIGGSGALTVSASRFAAGIGGRATYDGNGWAATPGDSGTITINSGTVTAMGGSNSAGIGGGERGSGTIAITGGTVTATGGANGAGIGGGGEGNGGTITISGGTVIAAGSWGAGIGGGNLGDGGTVYVSGGSVKATCLLGNADAIGRGSGGASSGTLQNNSTDKAPVYLTTITLADAFGSPIAAKTVTSLTSARNSLPYLYGTADMQTDGMGRIYVYLPDGSRTTEAQVSDGAPLPVLLGCLGDIATTSAGGSGTLSHDLPPCRRIDVAAATTVGVTVNTAYTLDLATIFADIDSNTLTYKVSVNGAAAVPADKNYSYTPTTTGTTTLVFRANDGILDSIDTYTVSLTASTAGGGEVILPIGYQATVSGIGGAGTALPINLDANGGRATLDLGTLSGSQIFGGGAAIITVPPVPGANAYTLEMTAASLSGSQGEGTLCFRTSAGNVTLPADMLAGVPGTEGKTVGITVGQGNVSTLPEAVRAAIGDRPLIQLTCTLDGVQTPWNNPDAPVTVSVPYTPTAAELAHPEHIVVWYIDGSGNAIAVPNGRYDRTTGMVTFTVTHFSQYAVAYVEKTFGDLGSVEWARESIEALASKGIINGTGENTYSPAARITRADYLVLLVKTLGLTADFNDNFDDVKPGAYYYEAVGIARKLGIAAGSGNNRFNPLEPISRQDMMVLTARALEKYKDLKAAPDSTVLDKYTDKGDIADYAVGSLATLVKEGLITGSGATINPLANTTRAEAAVFLYRVYNRY